MSDPTEPAKQPTSPRRTTWIVGLGCLLALILVTTITAVGLYTLAGSTQLFVDACPAKKHLEGVDADELLRVARALGSDVERQGFIYWNQAVEQPEPRVERPVNTRDLAELPAIIRDLAPLQVIVGGGGLTLTWDRPPYRYGYSMILLPAGADEARMTRDNGSSHWNEKIQDGIWSFYAFD